MEGYRSSWQISDAWHVSDSQNSYADDTIIELRSLFLALRCRARTRASFAKGQAPRGRMVHAASMGIDSSRIHIFASRLMQFNFSSKSILGRLKLD